MPVVLLLLHPFPLSNLSKCKAGELILVAMIIWWVRMGIAMVIYITPRPMPLVAAVIAVVILILCLWRIIVGGEVLIASMV
jgi:hypothetical protein